MIKGIKIVKYENCGMIISGPNAGGKSAALKCLALCADMFLKGLPIPAKDLEVTSPLRQEAQCFDIHSFPAPAFVPLLHT